MGVYLDSDPVAVVSSTVLLPRLWGVLITLLGAAFYIEALGACGGLLILMVDLYTCTGLCCLGDCPPTDFQGMFFTALIFISVLIWLRLCCF